MTEVKFGVKQKCAVCGHINFVSVTTGYTIFSERTSLDLRSGEGNWAPYYYLGLNICEKCHYINERLDELIPNCNKDFISSNNFEEIYNSDGDKSFSKIFLAAELNKLSKNYLKAGNLYLNCAWFCDDVECDEMANFMRRRSALSFDRFLKTNKDLNVAMILVDVYRRTGNFAEAKKLAEQLLKTKLDDKSRKIILFDIQLCRSFDDKIHYLN